LQLNINVPATGLTTAYSDFMLIGNTDIGATVTVNSSNVNVDITGAFSVNIPLTVGMNPLIVSSYLSPSDTEVIDTHIICQKYFVVPHYFYSEEVRIDSRTHDMSRYSMQNIYEFEALGSHVKAYYDTEKKMITSYYWDHLNYRWVVLEKHLTNKDYMYSNEISKKIINSIQSTFLTTVRSSQYKNLTTIGYVTQKALDVIPLPKAGENYSTFAGVLSSAFDTFANLFTLTVASTIKDLALQNGYNIVYVDGYEIIRQARTWTNCGEWRTMGTWPAPTRSVPGEPLGIDGGVFYTIRQAETVYGNSVL